MTHQKKRSGYDLSDWAAKNHSNSLNGLINDINSFHPPGKPDELSPIKRVWNFEDLKRAKTIFTDGRDCPLIKKLDELLTMAPAISESSEKYAEINGRAPEQSSSEFKPMRKMTDLGNAERFVDQHGDNFRYTHQLGWFEWDGSRWYNDEGALSASRASARTARSIHDEAQECDDKKISDALKKHAQKSESSGKIEAIIKLSRPKLADKIDNFDKNPMLINFLNGTYDLDNGKFRDHIRDDKLTQISNGNYNTNMDCPHWHQFLEDILPDPELRDYIQDAVGYSLTGSTSEQCLFICYGTGSNGKSTFTDTLLHVFGDYGRTIPSELMSTHASNNHPTALTELRGRRFTTAQETKEGGNIDEALIKQLSGGDKITARKMKADFFVFEPTHKLWLSTNHKPVIRGTDHGIWRRMRLIPFTVRIDDSKKDKNLIDKLRSETDGILKWAVTGAIRWRARGLISPDIITSATDDYRREQDTIGEWIDQNVVEATHGKLSKTAVYENYRDWCECEGLKPFSHRRLTQKLIERGWNEVRTASTRLWVGHSLIKIDDKEEGEVYSLF